LRSDGRCKFTSRPAEKKEANRLVARFSQQLGRDPDSYMRVADRFDIKLFLEWILENYSGVQTKSSLDSYWGCFKMVLSSEYDRVLDRHSTKDINNVSKTLSGQRRWGFGD